MSAQARRNVPCFMPRLNADGTVALPNACDDKPALGRTHVENGGTFL